MSRQKAVRDLPDALVGGFGQLRQRIPCDDPPPRKRVVALARQQQKQQQRGDTSELERYVQRQVAAHAPVHDTYHSELEQDGEAYPRGVLADALRDRDT